MRPAIEAHIQAGRIVAQRRLWDKDETLIYAVPFKDYVVERSTIDDDVFGI